MTDIDVDLVRRARIGDQAAARAIVEALHRPVIATIYRFLGRRQQSEVEDLAQDVFLKVFRSLDRFDPARGVKFTTWVYTFVRNHCFDTLRRRRIRAGSLSGGDDGGTIEPPDPHARRPGAGIETAELGAKIEEALAGLGEDQRMAFILREYEGLDYESIAEVMGVSPGTIKSRLHRAREALRARLEPFVRAGA